MRCAGLVCCARSLRLWLVMTVLVALAPAGDVEVNVKVPWTNPGGWMAVLVTVRSPTDHRTPITVECGQAKVITTAALKAGETWRRTLLLPPTASRYGSYGTNPRCEFTNPNGSRGSIWGTTGLDPQNGVALIAGRELDSEHFFQQVGNAVGTVAVPRVSTYGYASSVSAPSLSKTQRIDSDQLPDEWQAYPKWLHLVLTPKAVAELTSRQRLALTRWVGLGGCLMVPDELIADSFRAGGRRALVFPNPRPEAAKQSAAAWSRFAESVQKLQSTADDITTATPDSQVAGTERSGGAMFAVLAVVIAVIAGPGTIWWAYRRRRPLLLVVAIPVVGGVACALLLIWDFARYGIGQQRQAWEVTLIDAERGEHIAFSAQTLFGAWPSSQFSFADDTSVVVRRWVDDNTSRYREGSAITYFRDQNLLSGDVLRGRVTEHLAATQIRQDRRRIQLRAVPSAGADAVESVWMMTNGLGRTCSRFAWRDQQGRLWVSVGAVADGAEVPLQLAESFASHALPANAFLPVAASLWRALERRPGAWRAQLDGPLAPLPGPVASDVKPITVLVGGVIPAEPTVKVQP